MLFTFLVFSGQRIGQVEAVRPLHGWAEGNNLLRQSLQPDLVPSSSPSPCTHIPRQSGGRCSLSEMNVASHVGLAPPTFPNFVIDVAVVSVAKDNHAQDRSSQAWLWSWAIVVDDELLFFFFFFSILNPYIYIYIYIWACVGATNSEETNNDASKVIPNFKL